MHEDRTSRLDFLFITQAYNRKELSFDEWLALSREWALKMIEQHTCRKEPRPVIEHTPAKMD